MTNFYSDKVNFAFSSARTFKPDHVVLASARVDDSPSITGDAAETSWTELEIEDQDQSQKVGNFELGMSLIHDDGHGNLESVVYAGLSPTGTQHVVRKGDGSDIFVYSSNLRFLSQATLASLPSTPLDYQNEVGVSVTQEEARKLAYPKVLTPL